MCLVMFGLCIILITLSYILDPLSEDVLASRRMHYDPISRKRYGLSSFTFYEDILYCSDMGHSPDNFHEGSTETIVSIPILHLLSDKPSHIA